jgi:phosphatidylserine synthase 2
MPLRLRSSSRSRSRLDLADDKKEADEKETPPVLPPKENKRRATLALGPKQPEFDKTLDFFYTPHTISALIIMLSAFLYVALYGSDGSDNSYNIKAGLAAMLTTFMLISLLMFPDGPFIRPHPAVWRIVMASSAAYQLILVFILFQNKTDIRRWLAQIDPSLGIQLPERNYATNCDLTYDNVMSQLDEFVVAHVLGWVVKAMMLRDYWILWILSVMFEVMEYSLQHQLPNFAECWWDHWILDVLVCNWLGLWIGMKYNKFMEVKEYSWRGIRQIPSVSGKVKRAVAQFTPYSWSRFDWATTKDFSHFLMSIVIIITFLIGELNAFYLKYLLWIPPTNPLNTYRLLFFSMTAAAAINEAHQFVSDPEVTRLGAQAWLVLANLATEFLICLKFGKDEFHEPAPWHVKIFWVLFTSILTIYSVFQFLYKPWRLKPK